MSVMWKNKVSLIHSIKHLIYFQDTTFYNLRYKTTCFPLFNAGHIAAIQSLSNQCISSIDIARNMLKVLETKKQFDSNYYFAYATLEDDVNNFEDSEFFKDFKTFKKSFSQKAIDRIELATKKALKKDLDIITTAKASGKIYHMNIDLSDVKDNLINLGTHSFGVPYKSPLVITP